MTRKFSVDVIRQNRPSTSSLLKVAPAFPDLPAHRPASQIIAQSEVQHDQQPDEAGRYEYPRQTAAVTHLHKEKDHDQHFGYGNGERSDYIPGAEIKLRATPSQKEQQ